MTASHYLVYPDVNRQWRWTLYAHNGRKLANSGEGYINKQDCLLALDATANSKGIPVRQSA